MSESMQMKLYEHPQEFPTETETSVEKFYFLQDYILLTKQTEIIRNGRFYKIISAQNYELWRITMFIIIFINFLHSSHSYIFAFGKVTHFSYKLILGCDIIYAFDWLMALILYAYKRPGMEMETYRRDGLVLIIDFFFVFPYSYIYEFCVDDPDFMLLTGLRAISFCRLFHLPRYFHQKSERAGVNHWLHFIVQYFLYLYLFHHIFACIWFLMAFGGSPGATRGWAKNLGDSNMDILNWYVICIYCGSVFSMGCGPGDILPKNDHERLLTVLSMCIGFALCTGYLIGSMSAEFCKWTTRRAILRNQMVDINRYLAKISADSALVKLIKNYYRILWCYKKGVKESKHIELLPFPLQTEISFDINIGLLQCSVIFRDKPAPFLRTISYMMKHEFYQPGEYIFHQNVVKYKMIFVTSGVLEILSEEDNESSLISFGAGTCLGEVGLILTLPAKASMKAATYTEVQVLYRYDFITIIQLYPDIFVDIQEQLFNRVSEAIGKDSTEIQLVAYHLCVSYDVVRTPIQRLKKGMAKNDRTSYNVIRSVKKSNNFICLSTSIPWILHPDTSLMHTWEVFIALNALFVSVSYPYAVSFMRIFPRSLHVYSNFFDFFNVIDLYLTLTTAIRQKSYTIRTVTGILKYRMNTCAFYVDIFTVIYFQIFAYTTNDVKRYYYLFQLNRVLKVYRIWKLFQRFEHEMNDKIVTLRLVKYPIFMLLICFWFGSFLYLITCFEPQCLMNGWFYNKLRKDVDEQVKPSCTQHRLEISMYFALCWLSGLGFGDITVSSIIDRILIYLGILFGILMFGFCTAELSATITHNYQAKIDFQSDFTAVTNFLEDRNIKIRLKKRVVDFFVLQWYHDKGLSLYMEDLFYNASQKIQEDALLCERYAILSQVPLFQEADKDFVQLIVVGAKTIVLPPNETVSYAGETIRDMYIIQEGYCKQYSENKPILLGPNSSFGLINIVAGLPYLATTRTVTHVKLIQISDELFTRTLSKLPKVAKEFSDVLASYKDILNTYQDREWKVQDYNVSIKNRSFLYVPKYCRERHEDYTAQFTGSTVWLRYVMPPICILPSGLFLKIWIIIRLMAATITAALIPFQQVTVPYSGYIDDVLLAMDVVAWLDLLVMMFVGYYGDKNQLIVHPMKTALYYLKGTFSLDLMLCLPISYVIDFAMSYKHEANRSVLICVVQMLKIGQVYRLPQAFNYLEKDITRVGDFLQMIKFVPFMMLYVNVMAAIIIRMSCISCSIDNFNISEIVNDYVVREGYMQVEVHDYFLMCQVNSWLDRSDYRKYYRPIDIFIIAFYWGITTIVGCGFGDITAQYFEILNLIMTMMIIGILAFGYIFANISSHQAGVNNTLSQNQQLVLELKEYMNREDVPYEIRNEIIQHFEYRWKRTCGSEPNVILTNVHSSLHGDIVLDMYEKILKEVPLFENVNRSFYRIIGKQIREVYYRRREIIFRADDVVDSIYIIYRGKVEVMSKYNEMQAFMAAGGIFGNLTPYPKAKITATITALSNVDVLYMTTDSFYTILKKYPKVKAKMDLTLEQGLDFIIPTKFIDEMEEDDEDDKNTPNLPEEYLNRNSGTSSDSVPLKRGTLISTTSKGTISTMQLMFGTEIHCGGLLLFFLPHKWFRVALMPESLVYTVFDMLTMITSCINSLLVTYEFAFQHHSTWILSTTIIIDSIMLMKMFLEMHKAYENRFGDYIFSNKKILKRYFKNRKRRIYDCISNLPVYYFAYILLLFEIENASLWFSTLRLITLLRINNIIEYYNQKSNKLMTNRLYLKLSSIIMWLLLLTHIFACLWYLFACPLTFCYENSWFNSVLEIESDEIPTLDNKVRMYLFCMYFLLTVLTTTGTGDIHPYSIPEMLYVIFIMLVTKFLIGMFIGDVTNVLNSYTASVDNYEYGIIELKDYLQSENLSKHQMEKMWEYVKQLWSRSRGKQVPTLLKDIPYTSKCDMLFEIYGSTLRNTYLFAGVEDNFLRQLTVCLKATVFFPGNYIVQNGDSDQSMYFIHRGEVDILTVHPNLTETIHEILKSGEMFGIAPGLHQGVPHRFSYRARTVVDIASLRLSDWEFLLDSFPHVKHTVYSRASKIYVIV